jgi:hypothetical protein
MPREQTYSCVACEHSFGSKWALEDHAKNCPVKRNAELARIHEALRWKQGASKSRWSFATATRREPLPRITAHTWKMRADSGTGLARSISSPSTS